VGQRVTSNGKADEKTCGQLEMSGVDISTKHTRMRIKKVTPKHSTRERAEWTKRKNFAEAVETGNRRPTIFSSPLTKNLSRKSGRENWVQGSRLNLREREERWETEIQRKRGAALDGKVSTLTRMVITRKEGCYLEGSEFPSR